MCVLPVIGDGARTQISPLERSKQELRLLAAAGLEQVRFVDRTFNYDAGRAYELLEFMIGLNTKTRFQLEVSGDILTDPVLELLKKAPLRTASSLKSVCNLRTNRLCGRWRVVPIWNGCGRLCSF